MQKERLGAGTLTPVRLTRGVLGPCEGKGVLAGPGEVSSVGLLDARIAGLAEAP